MGEATDFRAGDAVHVKSIGKGTLREMRSGGRCVVDINGRSIVTTVDQLTAVERAVKRAASRPAPARRHLPEPARPAAASASLDLHGHTVDEALEAVAAFLNAALLAGANEVRIIHGRSGGKIKAAVHRQLRGIPSIRRYGVDPRNAGVTIVTL